jgi:hypothetical protein
MKNRVPFLMHVPVPWVFVLTNLLGVALESVRPTPRFANDGFGERHRRRSCILSRVR